MDISNLLDTAKTQLAQIRAQLASVGLSETLKSELLQNQDALQRAYESLLNQAGLYSDQTKQQLTDALASAKKSSLAATAEANKRTLLVTASIITGLVILAFIAHKIYKHRAI